MPTVTIHGEKAVDVEAGKKLVLAIEDAGIDILHRCGGNARVARPAASRSSTAASPPWESSRRSGWREGRPGAEYPPLLPDPRRIRRRGPGDQPLGRRRRSPGAPTHRLIDRSIEAARPSGASGRSPSASGPIATARLTCPSDAPRTACSVPNACGPGRRTTSIGGTCSVASSSSGDETARGTSERSARFLLVWRCIRHGRPDRSYQSTRSGPGHARRLASCSTATGPDPMDDQVHSSPTMTSNPHCTANAIATAAETTTADRSDPP